LIILLYPFLSTGETSINATNPKQYLLTGFPVLPFQKEIGVAGRFIKTLQQSEKY
jgi:hypothetical protein